MFIATYVNTWKQENDGFLINLAGRQRMLTQKMTKELYEFVVTTDKSGKPHQEFMEATRMTMKIFDMTLSALKDSGQVPVGLDLKNTEYRFSPAAEGEILSQLQKVTTQWKEFSSTIEIILSNRYSDADLKTINVENIRLLKEMNVAVIMMQEKAEASISKLLTSQIILVVTGLAFMVWVVFIIRDITGRIARMQEFCQLFGQGDLRARSGISGSDELGQMGKSLDNMAMSLQEIMSEIGNDAANLDETSDSLLQISNSVSEECKNSSGRSNSVAAATEEMSVNMNSVAAAVEETANNVSMIADSVSAMTETIKVITSDTERLVAKPVKQWISHSPHQPELMNLVLLQHRSVRLQRPSLKFLNRQIFLP